MNILVSESYNVRALLIVVYIYIYILTQVNALLGDFGLDCLIIVSLIHLRKRNKNVPHFPFSKD